MKQKLRTYSNNAVDNDKWSVISGTSAQIFNIYGPN